MPTLTIFTPAYNRAHTIGRTYESLCRQTCKDFEWLVVDDGSVDNTKELVEAWIHENKIQIRYIYQENQGMHGAHNTAYRNITTELNTCIDSDDYMPDDAVEKILSFWSKNGSDKYAGIIGLDVSMCDGAVIGTDFADLAITLTTYYDNGGSGDKKIVYRTAVIQQYPEYPLFKGEKYVSLATKYFMIDQDWTLLTMNEPLAVVEYQSDGSSLNMYRQYKLNPQGFVYDRKLVLSNNPRLLKKAKYCCHYIANKLLACQFDIISDSPAPLMTFVMLPIGFLWYAFIQYKNVVHAGRYSR